MKNIVICLLLAGAISTPASAFDWGLEGRAGYTYSDNVAQAPIGESAGILGTEISALIEHASRTLVLDAEANYLYRHFLDDQYDSESIPQLRGSLEWLPWPDHLRFAVEDTYGQLALNPAEGLLPSEYESANVLTAGPTFIWPFSLDTRMQVSGEYRDATFDESDLDTQRQYGEFRVEHDLTRLISIFGGVSRSHTEFDDSGVQSAFDIDSAFLGFDGIGRRSALTIDAGFDSLDDGDETFEGVRYDVTYERQLSTDSRIFVGASRELADSADVFSLAQISDSALSGIQDVQVTSQPLQRDAYLLGYGLTGGRLSFTVSGGYRKENYLLTPDDPATTTGVDRDIREVLLQAEYVWSQPVRLGLRAELLLEEFVTGVGSDDLLLSLSWRRQFTQHFSVEASTERIERTNSPRDFEEMRYLLYFQYSVRELTTQRTIAFDRAFERRVRRSRDAVSEPVSSPSGSGLPEASAEQAPQP